MHLITSPQDFSLNSANYEGTCVTIGNFDGLHVGHQSLLNRALERSIQQKLMPAVVTFWPHPLMILAGARAPALITPQSERLQRFANQGIALTLELQFTKEIASLSPEEFVQHVLVPLKCHHLIIGYDFSLGKNRAGNFEVLLELGKKYSFSVEQLPPVIVLDAVVSSTRIRDLIKGGDLWDVQSLLGRYYTIKGTVVTGHGRGSGLGFPTANISTQHATLPKQGVYATWITGIIDKNSPSSKQIVLPAVTNIGYVPTFGNEKLSIESFFLEGEFDVYGQELCLYFVQRIRDEQRFDSIAKLIERVTKDTEIARNILDDAPKP